MAKDGIGASSTEMLEPGMDIAVPTEEQKRSFTGLAEGVESERLTKFLNVSSCDTKLDTGRAKLTAHAQCIICVIWLES